MAQFKLENVRLSFPSLFKRAVFEGKETKYEATLLMAKTDTSNISKVEKAIADLVKEFSINKAAIPVDKMCFRDGNTVFNKDGEVYEGYVDHMSFKASNNKRFQIVDRSNNPISEEDNIIYAGCYVNAFVDVWYQNNGYGRRINGNIYGLQFVRDGELFGASSPTVAEMFTTLDSELDF